MELQLAIFDGPLRSHMQPAQITMVVQGATHMRNDASTGYLSIEEILGGFTNPSGHGEGLFTPVYGVAQFSPGSIIEIAQVHWTPPRPLLMV